MLEEFVQQEPFQFIKKGGYSCILDYNSELIHLQELDIENENTKHSILISIMDLKDEEKTEASIRYKGKGTSRWFRVVYPDALNPILLGLFNESGKLIGFISILNSFVNEKRRNIGIALIKKKRGKGIGEVSIRHIQDHLIEICSPKITNLYFVTSRDNFVVLLLAKKLAFKEDNSSRDSKKWGAGDENRINFSWEKGSDTI